MARVVATVLSITLLFFSSVLSAQEKLSRLIPDLYGPAGLFVESDVATLDGKTTHIAHFNSSFQTSFSPFNTAFASQVALVTAPSLASGFSYAFDPSLGTYSKAAHSFGPIVSDRAETIGRGKASVGFSFQRFAYDTLDGAELTDLPVVFSHDDAAPGPRADVITTLNSIRAEISQFTAFLNYGLTDTMDISVALPIIDVNLAVNSQATIRRLGTANKPETHYFRPPGASGFGTQQAFSDSASAVGLGDVSARFKANVYSTGPSRFAVGLELRVPTGDEEDLLGSGALGLKQFAVWSYSGRSVSPHVKLAYEYNGKSQLAGSVVTGQRSDLPDQLFGEIGADLSVSKKLTLAVDLLGRRVIDGQRLSTTTFTALDGRSQFPTSTFSRSSYNILDAAVGFKANPAGNLLVDFAVRFKLNDAGLRDKATPLVAVEYGF